MEYAQAAAADDYASYVERVRSESEDDYRERVLGNGRGEVLRALVDQASTLQMPAVVL
jgi:hypothetical protein